MTPTTPPAIPSDIPQDVIDAAATAYLAYCDEQSRLAQMPTEEELLNVAARAVMAERARCEDCVAALIRNGFMLEGERTFADLIINAIREGN